MQTAPPIFCDDAANQVTLAAQTQAVERAIQVMHTHLHELLTLEDLAAVAYLSPFHFTRVFGRLIGIPPGEFLSALRFQAARRLLVTTALSVTDICFEVGYTSIGSFTSRFTHRVGLSPRLLRQRAQAFEPPAAEPAELGPTTSSGMPRKHALLGRISAPATFRVTIYVGLFPSPILQGAPVQCTSLSSPGWYLLQDVPDGVYPPLISVAWREAVAWQQREPTYHLAGAGIWRAQSRSAPAASDRPTSGDGIALAWKGRYSRSKSSRLEKFFLVSLL